MPENDDGIKIISSLGLNYKQAIESTQQFAESLKDLNTQLEKIKKSAAITASELNQAFSKTGQQFVADGEKISRVITQQAKKAAQTTQQQLAQLESSLVSTAERMQRLGVTVPGLSGKITEVRGLRDQLTTGRQLTEEQKKAVAAASEYAVIQANNAKTLEKEVKILADGVKGEQMKTDAASRRQMAEIRAQEAINKQWDEYLAKQRTADERLKRQQMEQIWTAQAKAEAETARTLEAKTKEEIRYYETMLASEALREKQAAEAARMLPLIEAQVAATQNKLQVEGLSNSQLTQQANIIRQQVTELQRRLSVEGKLTEAEFAQVNALKQQTATLSANTKTALADLATQQKIQKELTKQQGVFSSQLERRISWFVAGAGFFGIINTMRQMVEAAGDVEMGMVQIGRVMEDSSFKVEKMRKSLIDLGMEYGTSWKDVQDITLRWAQAGYNVADSLELTRASLLALNTAELDAQQATEGMIAILSQWGMTSDQLLPTIDKINKVADDYAVTSQDLVDGLNRSSGAAKLLGLSLEETISILTVMREATGRTGKEIGNALNSILSFMQRPKALKGFEELGIQVWADEAKTQFRDVMEVFSELAARWPEVEQNVDISNMFAEAAKEAGLYSEVLSEAVGIQEEFNDVQAAEAAGLAAGVYRRNYLVALLKNWGKVSEVLKTQEEALGYSMKENERTMESYQKKVEALRTSLTGLAVGVMEAGALDRMKEAVDGIRDVVDVFLELPPGVQRAIVAFGEFSAALALTQLGLRTFFDVGLPTAIRNLAAFVTGMTAAEARALSLGTALRMLAFNPWTMAIAGLTAVVGLLIKWRIEAKKAAEEQQKLNEGIKEWRRIAALGLTKEEAPKYSKSIEEIIDLVSKYDELIAKRNELAEEMSKSYEAASNQRLITEFGELSQKIEEVEKALRKHNITVEEAKKHMDGLRAAARQAEVFQFNADAIADEAKATKSNSETKLKLIERYQQLAKGVKTQADYAKLSEQRQKELSSVAQQLASYYPELVVLTDEHGNAILFESKALSNQIPILKELAATSISEAKARIKAEQEKTASVISNIRKRIQAMLTEKQALVSYYSLTNEEITALGMIKSAPYSGLQRAEQLTKEIAEQQRQLREAEEKSRALSNALKQLDGVTVPVSRGVSSVGESVSSVGKSSKDATTWLDRFGETLEGIIPVNIVRDFYYLQNAIEGITQQVTRLSAEEEFLKAKLEEGNITQAERERLAVVLAAKTKILTQENEKLTISNTMIEQQLKYLNEALKTTEQRYRAVNTEAGKREALQAIEDTMSKIKELTAAYDQNVQKIYENQRAVMELSSSLERTYYDQYTSWVNHMAAMGRLTTQQQLERLQVLDVSALTLQEQWKHEEEIHNKRKEAIQDEINAIKDAYEERMNLIDAEIEANEELIQQREEEIARLQEETELRVKAIQEQIDALKQESEQDERIQAEREHNKKLQELYEQRRYHELRTGLEHQQAIADIDKQIAEEEHNWELQKQEWARDARKEELQEQINAIEESAKEREKALQDEINDIKKANDKKKNEMQKYYNQIQDILIDSNVDMLATLSIFDQGWYDRFKEWADKAVEGFKAGRVSERIRGELSDLIGEAKEEYENLPPAGEGEGEEPPPTQQKLPKAVISRGEYIAKNGRTYIWSQELAQKLGTTAEWDQELQLVKIGGKYFFPAWTSNGKSYVGIREVAELLGYRATYDNTTGTVSIWDKAHTGAYVLKSGVAELLKGERVLSPQLTVSFDRLAATLSKTPSLPDRISINNGANIEWAVKTLVAAIEENGGVRINGNLLNIENAGFEDRADIDILTRQLGQVVTNRRLVRGR